LLSLGVLLYENSSLVAGGLLGCRVIFKVTGKFPATDILILQVPSRENSEAIEHNVILPVQRG
jgi:hypothetical protein